LIRPRHHSTVLFRPLKPDRAGKEKDSTDMYRLPKAKREDNESAISNYANYRRPDRSSAKSETVWYDRFKKWILLCIFYVAKDNRKYTSFVVPNGQYEFLRMPFGLYVAPAYFQRYQCCIRRFKVSWWFTWMI